MDTLVSTEWLANALETSVPGAGDLRVVDATYAEGRDAAADYAAAHIPGHLRGGHAITLLRLEGFGPSIRARMAMLDVLAGDGKVLDEGEADALKVFGPEDFGAPAGAPA